MVSHRQALPSPTPSADLNIFGVLRKNVGKDLSKVSMPVSFNEPLNMLQRLCEELEYSELLVCLLALLCFAIMEKEGKNSEPVGISNCF